MKYESRAALLRAAADSIEMQEKAGIDPMCKNHRGDIFSLISAAHFSPNYSEFEFPLAVVEGKPVFAGDKLQSRHSGEYTAVSSKQFLDSPETIHILDANGKGYIRADWSSWPKPKPRTVMVELLREDAEHMALDDRVHLLRVNAACRKALEEL